MEVSNFHNVQIEICELICFDVDSSFLKNLTNATWEILDILNLVSRETVILSTYLVLKNGN